MKYDVFPIREHPQWKDEAALWFHRIWNVGVSEYADSMEQSIVGGDPVPQWYIVVDDGAIIAGAGVIENDFHDCKELRPNICAVYVEPAYRRQGIAGAVLDAVCRDLKSFGISKVYLVTEHTSFYERYGWKYCGLAHDEIDGTVLRVYCRLMQ